MTAIAVPARCGKDGTRPVWWISVAFLLHCYRCIERNPLRASRVANPADYRWSSYACHALAAADPLIQPHVSYLGLGSDVAERCTAYRKLVGQTITPYELDGVRLHLQRQHACGAEYFRVAIDAQLSRRRSCQDRQA